MYVNTVFFRKPGTHGGIDAITRIQEDYRKWCKCHYNNDGIHIAEISPEGLVHIHSIIYFSNSIKGYEYIDHLNKYEMMDDKNKVFVCKQSIIQSEKEMLSYYKYIHKTINYINFCDKKYRICKIISDSKLTAHTRAVNKVYGEQAAALAEARPEGGSTYTPQQLLISKQLLESEHANKLQRKQTSYNLLKNKYSEDMFLEI